MLRAAETIGRGVARSVGEAGFAGALFAESVFWTLFGRARSQPVRLPAPRCVSSVIRSPSGMSS